MQMLSKLTLLYGVELSCKMPFISELALPRSADSSSLQPDKNIVSSSFTHSVYAQVLLRPLAPLPPNSQCIPAAVGE